MKIAFLKAGLSSIKFALAITPFLLVASVIIWLIWITYPTFFYITGGTLSILAFAAWMEWGLNVITGR